MKHRVVIIGGGFGGLYAAQHLRRARDLRVTLLDKRNFHLFQPLLYQVATGGLSPANIAAPLRGVLRSQRNAEVLLAEVTGLDAAARQVHAAGQVFPYDTLVVAAGAVNHYFGHDDWEETAPGLKTLEQAAEIRARVFLAFEQAELRHATPGAAPRPGELTFAIIGAGPTGVELAGTLAEIARETLRRDFRHVDPARARVVLIEGSTRVLEAFDEQLSARAAADLARLGVELMLGARAEEVHADRVVLRRGDALFELPVAVVLWAAGVRGNPLGAALARATGATLDRGGRVVVGPDLSLPGHPEIFVIGDLAACSDAAGKPLPGVAPVAMQQGAYVAGVIRARLKRARGDGRAPPHFRYAARGNLATIGRAAAVAELGKARFSGYFAWLLWLFVHLYFLIAFQNRLLVMIQWAWNYLTWGRAARLITRPRAAGEQSGGAEPLSRG